MLQVAQDAVRAARAGDGRGDGGRRRTDHPRSWTAWGPDYRSHGAPLWDLALAVPLVLRRRSPGIAAAAVGLICLAQWIAGPLADGDVAVLVMLYSLGSARGAPLGARPRCGGRRTRRRHGRHQVGPGLGAMAVRAVDHRAR